MAQAKKGMSPLMLVLLIVGGLTLLAICAATGMAMLGGAAAFGAMSQAQVQSTRTDARVVHGAALVYMADHGVEHCPTPAELVDEGELARSARLTDAWNHDFVIECGTDEVVVKSNGPDGRAGTDDDISVR